MKDRIYPTFRSTLPYNVPSIDKTRPKVSWREESTAQAGKNVGLGALQTGDKVRPALNHYCRLLVVVVAMPMPILCSSIDGRRVSITPRAG